MSVPSSGLGAPPEVDVIIAIHTPERDVRRAVGSLLDHTRAQIRVTIVCHNTPVAGVCERLGAAAADPRVRFLSHTDGIRSPAGPFNAGLDAATAPYIAVLGSDDELSPGAIDSWLHTARRGAAAMVIARVRHAGGAALPSPPTRPFRRRALDGVRDRLSYRSAPLGLVSREHFPELRFATGVRTGEDVQYVTSIWFSGAPIIYDRDGPAYLIHSDGAERVTTQFPPIAQDLEFLEPLLASAAVTRLSERERHSVLIKLVRSTLFGVIHNRPDPDSWNAAERTKLARVARELRVLLAATQLGEGILGRAERALFDAAAHPEVSTPELLARAEARRKFFTPAALLTVRLKDVFRREAPLRFAAATVLARF